MLSLKKWKLPRIRINQIHHNKLFTSNAQTKKLQPFGVLLLRVLNLDHMCHWSSLGLGWLVFAPGMFIRPQLAVIFVFAREKHRFDGLCHNQQLLTKDIKHLVEGRDLSLDSSEIRNLNLFLSIFHGLLINLLQRCCNRWLLDQVTPQAQSFHCPSRRLHFENRFDLIKVVPGMLLESGWFFEST